MLVEGIHGLEQWTKEDGQLCDWVKLVSHPETMPGDVFYRRVYPIPYSSESGSIPQPKPPGWVELRNHFLFPEGEVGHTTTTNLRLGYGQRCKATLFYKTEARVYHALR